VRALLVPALVSSERVPPRDARAMSSPRRARRSRRPAAPAATGRRDVIFPRAPSLLPNH
jgi:hypothetical protein